MKHQIKIHKSLNILLALIMVFGAIGQPVQAAAARPSHADDISTNSANETTAAEMLSLVPVSNHSIQSLLLLSLNV